MLFCQKWRFWWILLEQIGYSKRKEEKSTSPFLTEFATLYTQYPWHYCSYCHNRTKEIYKDNHNCVFTIVSTMHASKDLLKFPGSATTKAEELSFLVDDLVLPIIVEQVSVKQASQKQCFQIPVKFCQKMVMLTVQYLTSINLYFKKRRLSKI